MIILIFIGIIFAVIPGYRYIANTPVRNAHKIERKHINAQIQLFFVNHKDFPKSMQNKDWTTHNHALWQTYFPDGVPEKCTFGDPWIIQNNQILITGHTKHE
ncbi:MAG: hypothetical protein HRT90_00405 [Candidatus Margulisbacteria bacterium]|nr:hypothetical protein [Candidatus Margulisiibacteriota bacterium]